MSEHSEPDNLPETEDATLRAAGIARVVSFSGGLGSWYAARRVRDAHGTGEMTPLFTDVAQEDEDLYRFVVEGAADLFGVPLGDVAELSARALALPPVWRRDLKPERRRQLETLAREAEERVPGLVWLAQGKDVWDVFRKERFLGNSRIDPCSRVLKREAAEAWVKARYGPGEVVVYLGIDWTEEVRHMKTRARWRPYPVESPLCEEPRDEDPKGAARELLAASGIEPPRLYRLGFEHNNCFHPDTRFITNEGIKTLRETRGRRVKVLGTGAGWKDAEVRSFGKQRLWELKLRRYDEERPILTTEDHRWFVRRGRTSRREARTSDLRAGEKLASITGGVGSGVRPSAFGIAHGIVFGDGTRPRYRDGRGWNPPANVVLCGEKDAELLRWFPLSPTREVAGVGLRINDLPHHFKEPPELTESRSYLYGWLAGYFAADGGISKGSPNIHSARRENLELARDVATRVGIATGSIRSEERTGIDGRQGTLYRVPLIPSTLREDFFLLTAHREAYSRAERRIRIADWTVVSVEPTSRVEEVMCAVVPDGRAFALDGNILTGNCGGACVKAGKGQWARLLDTMPEVYRHHEEEEQDLREYLGKDVTILREQRDGVRYGITLRELRERLEGPGRG